MRRNLLRFVARRCEPMRAQYSLSEMGAVTAQCGFRTLAALAVSALGEYYAAREGETLLAIPGIFGVAVLEVE